LLYVNPANPSPDLHINRWKERQMDQLILALFSLGLILSPRELALEPLNAVNCRAKSFKDLA
jgi:hypothetical protein